MKMTLALSPGMMLMVMVVALLLSSPCSFHGVEGFECNGTRPEPRLRKFASKEVDEFLDVWVPRLKDRELASIFNVTLANALDTTFEHVDGRDDTFVITGDIKAMWIRDSTFQVRPYARYFLRRNARTPLSDALCGLVRRQARSVLLDQYANAFNFDGKGPGGPHQGDRRRPKMTKHLYEGKYELDTLVSFLHLSNEYYGATEDREVRSADGNSLTPEALLDLTPLSFPPCVQPHCSAKCFDEGWLKAIEAVLQTVQVQQRSTGDEGVSPAYQFWRSEGDLSYNGTGNPGRRTRMAKSGFRPSDDPCQHPFHVPSNMWLQKELRDLNGTLAHLGRGKTLAALAVELAIQVAEGLKHALVPSPLNASETILAYEVDGYGSRVIMDDANAPSLLSLPYLESVPSAAGDEEVFLRTKKVVLSKDTNPYYFEGSSGLRGVGSPHVGYGMIWPLGVIYDLFGPEKSDEGILAGLDVLKRSAAGTNCMHESFWKEDPSVFTRQWFAWANSAFAELIVFLLRTRPHLLLPKPFLDAWTKTAGGEGGAARQKKHR
ncbi:metal-independent alpha-mannosidase [Chloropicon primus]|nr:metal-independent alpha-mannosidase [Chloropicon primus]